MSDTSEKSRFELFKEAFEADREGHQQRMQESGMFCFDKYIKSLSKLQSNINTAMMVYLFGEHPGCHLAEKFAIECRGNMLYWLQQLSDEYRFFILYELKTNKSLFAYS